MADQEVSDPVGLVKLTAEQLRGNVLEIEKVDRLTMVINVHHEHCCTEPVSVEYRKSHKLKTQEEPYQRRFKVRVDHGETPLDLNWLAGEPISYIILRNNHGEHRTTLPTPVEQSEMEKHVVELRYRGDARGWSLAPGDIFLAKPTDAEKLVLVSMHGITEVKITVIPG